MVNPESAMAHWHGSVGVIGLGRMGAAIAGRLAACGTDVVVWNRTAQVAKDVARTHGLEAVSSVHDVAARCEVVLSVVAGESALHDVCAGPFGLVAAMRPDSVLVDLGTTGPAVVERLAPRLAAKGVNLLESPLSGTPTRASEGRLVPLVGGPHHLFERVRPLFEQLGVPVHVGPLGAGTAMKLALNSVIFAHNHAVAEGLLLAEVGGVRPEVFLDVLSSSTVATPLQSFLTPQYLDPSVKLGVGTFETADKDLGLAADAADGAGVRLPMVSLVRAVVHELSNGDATAEIGTVVAHMRAAQRASTSQFNHQSHKEHR